MVEEESMRSKGKKVSYKPRNEREERKSTALLLGNDWVISVSMVC